MKKLFAGVSFLYREGGYNSTVFEVQLKRNVRGDILQHALTTTMTRYPYLAQKLVERNGDFYLEDDFNSMIARPTSKLSKLGSMATGYHLVDITYFKHSIRIAFHHALCDGRGIKPFIQTLIYYYCCYADGKDYNGEGIRLAGQPLLDGEETDPFDCGLFEVDGEVPTPYVERNGFHLTENDLPDGDFRAKVSCDNNKFVRYAKEHGATPAVLLALLLAESVAAVRPYFDKPIVAQLAFDTRDALGLPNTHHNCVSTINLAYTEGMRGLSLNERSKIFREELNAQRQKNYVRKVVNGQIEALARLSTGHTLDERLKNLDFFNHLCPDTFNISYIGVFNFGEYADSVEEVRLYSSGTAGLRANMCSAGGRMAIDIIQSFSSPVYYNAFIEQLEMTGIPFRADGLAPFDTPKDKTQITAPRQAERFKVKKIKE